MATVINLCFSAWRGLSGVTQRNDIKPETLRNYWTHPHSERRDESSPLDGRNSESCVFPPCKEMPHFTNGKNMSEVVFAGSDSCENHSTHDKGNKLC